MGHGPSGEHLGGVLEPLEGHLGDLASPGAPKAIEAVRAQITFATLERNACSKKKHQFYCVFLRVRAPGDVIYSNLAHLLGARWPVTTTSPLPKPPEPLQLQAVW